MDRLRRLVPILAWLPRYRRGDLTGDLTAGLTTAVMLIPQAMAYAMLAGLPPIVGLYAAIAPPFVYALFGSSAKLAVGPVAMDSLLVAAALTSVTLVGHETPVVAAAALAVMVGAIQLVMGSLRLGFIVNFLSQPVLSGFTSAAAVVIAASQLGALLGVKLSGEHRVDPRCARVRASSTLLIMLVSVAFAAVVVVGWRSASSPRSVGLLGARRNSRRLAEPRVAHDVVVDARRARACRVDDRATLVHGGDLVGARCGRPRRSARGRPRVGRARAQHPARSRAASDAPGRHPSAGASAMKR
jgi:MFS superfamily sulfate permease-like transporter